MILTKMILFAIVAAVFVVSILFCARWFERCNIYFPDRNVEYTPEVLGEQYEDVYFGTKDGVRLNGWFLFSKEPPRGTVIFCHGNAGNIGDRIDIIRVLNALRLNIFIFDYRGYGKSEGRPSEKGTYIDVLAAYDYVLSREDIDTDRIVVYGKSLGGCVAIDLAGRSKVRALIIDSTFLSISDMVKEIYPFLPARFINSIKYDNISKIGNIRIPKLIIHSEYDEIIPFRHGKMLYERAAGPKKFYVMQGAHNDAIFEYENDFKETVSCFLGDAGM